MKSKLKGLLGNDGIKINGSVIVESDDSIVEMHKVNGKLVVDDITNDFNSMKSPS